jgi:hypothetical protein
MKYLDIKYILSVGQILSAEFKTLIYVPAYGHVTVVYCYNLLVYLQRIKNYYYKITEQQFLAIYHVITLAQKKKITNHLIYLPCD